MKILLRSCSILVYSIPAVILVAGCVLKDIQFADAGMLLFGLIIGLIGGLYTWFGASEKWKLPLGVMVVGLVLTICSFVAVVIGLALIAAPVSFMGGSKLWSQGGKN